MNLISKLSEKDLLDRHIKDSGQLMKFLSPDDVVCDLGSGAGLPGIVLSIMGIKHVILIESDEKKVSFLKYASRSSANYVEIINDRVENISPIEVDVVVARALGTVDEILNFISKVTPRKFFLLPKGKEFKNEINEASQKWNFNYSAFSSETAPNAAILKIYDVHRK
jgi:16S rRNA (guanine527-N7)-methyltransferase